MQTAFLKRWLAFQYPKWSFTQFNLEMATLNREKLFCSW